MESAHEHPARAHEHPAASEHDVQYAMESAYTTETPRGQGGGDAYSQSLDPPNLSSFSEDNAAEGEAGAKLNAEESAALRSFLAGGDESGEGVVVDWSVVLPLAQAVCLLCAFVIVVCGLTTPNWKLGVALGAHGRATVGLKQLVLLDVRPKSAGIFALSDVCKGFDAPMTAAVVNATKSVAGAAATAVMDPEMACAYARSGNAVNGLAGAALALLAALLLMNLYVAFSARGIFSFAQPLIRPLESKLAELPVPVYQALPTAAWAGALFFLALALVVFGSTAPSGLGLGAGQLGLSFGAVRLGCLFVALGLGVHATALSEVWRAELLSGTSILIAKWRLLHDRKVKGLLATLTLCVILNMLLWTRAVDWSITLPVLGMVSILFEQTKGAMAYCVLTGLAIFFEVVDISADGVSLAKGEAWLQIVAWVLLLAQVASLSGVVYLKIMNAHA